MKAPVLIAANPYSGATENRRCVSELSAALNARGIASRVVWDPAERAALLADPDSGRSCRCVVVAGGDGTVADVVNDRPQMPMAVLPLGVENIFAKYFGFSRNVSVLADLITEGHSRTIDLGRDGDRFFSLMLSVGIDADVVHRFTRRRAKSAALKRATHGSYAMPILASAARYRFPRIELEADGMTVTCAHAFVFNVSRYSLGLFVLPHARCDDGRLDWVVLKRPGVLSCLSYLWSVPRRTLLERPDVCFGRARHVRIAANPAAPVQIDGEPAGLSPVEVEVVPQALTVLTRARAEVSDGG